MTNTKPTQKKSCFVISPIGDEKSETRRRSDQVLRHLIEAALAKFPYDVRRADKIDQSGMITSQIIERVLMADLVVADLSEGNPNVYYELALRHVARKPFIHLIRAGDRIPFDVSPNRTVSYDLGDPDSVQAARDQIAAQVQSIEGGQFEFDNPISQTQDLLTLRKSEKPDEKALGKLFEQVLANQFVTFKALNELTDQIGMLDARIRVTVPHATPFGLPVTGLPGMSVTGTMPRGGVFFGDSDQVAPSNSPRFSKGEKE